MNQSAPILSRPQQILALAEAYALAKGIRLKTVSRRVFQNGTRLALLVTGDLNTRTADAAIDWFSRHWPADTPWPDDVDRLELNEDGSLFEPVFEVAPAVAAAVSGSSPSTSTEPEVPHG